LLLLVLLSALLFTLVMRLIMMGLVFGKNLPGLGQFQLLSNLQLSAGKGLHISDDLLVAYRFTVPGKVGLLHVVSNHAHQVILLFALFQFHSLFDHQLNGTSIVLGLNPVL